jgi:hypothetical protein
MWSPLSTDSGSRSRRHGTADNVNRLASSFAKVSRRLRGVADRSAAPASTKWEAGAYPEVCGDTFVDAWSCGPTAPRTYDLVRVKVSSTASFDVTPIASISCFPLYPDFVVGRSPLHENDPSL